MTFFPACCIGTNVGMINGQSEMVEAVVRIYMMTSR